jgi:beta-galactosidase
MHRFEISRWAFTLTDTPDAWQKGYDDSSWRQVTVPHDWSVEQPFSAACSSGTGYLPGGIGWYRAHVPLREVGDLSGRHVRLVFHGVYKNAQVWVNGYHLGGRPSGYAEFSFDLTEILSYASGDDLVVTVRVQHTDISDSRWYNGSGITRRVELQVHDLVRVAEHGTTFTTLAADSAEAMVRIAQVLVNDTAETVAVRATHELRSLSSAEVHTVAAEVAVPAGTSAEANAELRVAQPELWSDRTPHLYCLTTTLNWTSAGEERSAVYVETVGIRTFRFDPDRGFFINGEPRTLNGVCLHEDAGCLGTAVPTGVWLRRLLKLREMGCNAVRMAHNPHAPELYRLCDALGFFVIDEAFDEWENPKNKWWQGHNVYPPRHEGYAHDFHAWHERDLGAMVDAHRNHPSIIAWSIGNEIDYPNDPYASPLFAEMTGNNDARKTARQRSYDPNRPDARRLPTIARRLIDIVRQKDPTRPVTIGAAYPELSTRTGLIELFDLAGYNYKEHLYAEDHARFPAMPLVGSENGHRYADWLAVAENDYVAGQFLWTGIDYLGEAHGWPIHGSGAGLLTLAGYEKHSFHLRRSWWTDEPVAYIATRPFVDADEKTFWSHPIARQWGESSGEPMEILCFSNGEPRLSCGGAELPLLRDEENGYWVTVTPARDEPLVLETWRDGKVVARDELGRRGEPVRIEAVVWQAPAEALQRCEAVGLDANDVIQVECTLCDAEGKVAGTDRLLSATLDGGGLLGLENGDLSDNTPYTVPQRSTLDGRLIVFVRPGDGRTPKLSAPGLPDAALSLEEGV